MERASSDGAAAVSTATTTRPSIISPWVDALCVGGAFATLFVVAIVAGRRFDEWMSPDLMWPILLINLPHFMASYRIVYSSRERIRRYPWTSIYAPALLFTYCVFALVVSGRSMAFIDALTFVAGAYLAWHYTGQTWGMMAAFSQLDGNPFSDREKRLVRLALRILLAWHVSWISQVGIGLPAWLQDAMLVAYGLLSWVTLGAVALSGAALALFVRRTHSMPSTRVMIAWLSIFLWYGAMARSPRAIYWVQIAHATQYLIFPFRVELNQRLADVREMVGEARLIDRAGFQMCVYAAALLLAGAVYQVWLPGAIEWAAGSAMGAQAVIALPFALNGFLNIHHFFTDGNIWKLSDPDVRRMLFAHVARPS